MDEAKSSMTAASPRQNALKRSIMFRGHRTSVSLEDAFWKALRDIAAAEQMPLPRLIAAIDTERQHANLSSAIRQFVLEYYQARICALEKQLKMM
jgi:predicted DNA-binding ribbon-helix-helix protein